MTKLNHNDLNTQMEPRKWKTNFLIELFNHLLSIGSLFDLEKILFDLIGFDELHLFFMFFLLSLAGFSS